MNFLDQTINSDISNLINKKLLSGRFKENEIYDLLDKNLSINDLNFVFNSLLKNKSHLKNIGIDLPIWYGDYNSTTKTMVVALDPKRNNQENKDISIGSVFGLHTTEGKNTNRNDYWNFVSYLAQTGFVYLTDIYKIYYETKNEKGQNLISNKDKSFIEKECYQQNKSILEEEILNIVKPNQIISLGVDAANAVKGITKIKTNDIQFQQDGIQYIFLPHIARTVTQSIKTIGNLYKGIGLITGKLDIQNVGDAILKNSELKKIFS
jgi:hypothetical protein